MTDQTSITPTSPDVPREHRWLRPVAEAGIIVALFAVVGAGCGWLWEHQWTAPTGGAYRGKWYPDAAGSERLFDGTGSFVLIAALAGLLLGLLCAWAFTASEIGTVVATLAGGVLAGWLMHAVGLQLAPPDPAARAREAADFTPLSGTLRTFGDSYRVAFPGGALVGPALLFLCLPARRRDEPANPLGS